MNKKILSVFHSLILIVAMTSLTSCEKLFMVEEGDGNAEAVFEYLWERVDSHYALFDVKDVDWQAVHDSLAPQVYRGMSDDSLFRVLHKMLNTLNDGHVDLWSSDDVASSEQIFLQRYGVKNFDINTVALTYLRADHHTTGGFAYNDIADHQVLYIRYSSFSNSASAANLKKALERFPEVKGIILDIRQNGGGQIQNEWNLMSMLPSHGQLLYTTQIKNGPSHDAFSSPTSVYAPGNGDNEPIHKPVVVLTDRGCYSAASSFALCAKSYDNVIVMGDTTAGGLSVPTGGALPNGWYYRFGVTRTIAPDGVNYENGVPPDHLVLLSPAALAQNRDNIIDSAAALIVKP